MRAFVLLASLLVGCGEPTGAMDAAVADLSCSAALPFCDVNSLPRMCVAGDQCADHKCGGLVCTCAVGSLWSCLSGPMRDMSAAQDLSSHD